MKTSKCPILLLVLFAAMTESALSMPEIIAHRGYSSRVPENTTAAMELGWKHAQINELDIHLSRDERLIVIHDATTSRTAVEDHAVSATASSVLRQLDAGVWKGQEFAGLKLPFLEEIFEMMPDGKELFIEIKSGVETVPVLDKAISKSGKRSQFRIITFHYDVAKAAKEQLEGIPVYWLVSLKKDKQGVTPKSYSPDLVTSAVKAKLDGLNLSFKGVDQDIIAATRKAGLKFYAWTVDEPDEAIRLFRLGVDGITTNDPLLIEKTIKEASAQKPAATSESAKPDNNANSDSGAKKAEQKARRAKRRAR